MTVRHMRIFVEVVKTQNVTRAAERLHMTQPAVTRAIQELEHYYGVSLFERINRRLSVTETGKMLYQQALHIVDSFDALEKGLYNWDSFGVLRVGSSITIGNYGMPEYVLVFKERYPRVRVEMTVMNSGSLVEALMDNRLDVALIENSVDNENLSCRKFSHDRLLLITPPEHPLLKMESVCLAELLKYDLFAREPGSAGRNYIENVFASRELMLHPAMVSISTQAIINAVHLGLGISLLPQRLVENDIKKGNVSTRDIADADLRREHNIVWHKNKYLSPMLSTFIDICEKSADLETGE